jgi:hypothetical protein
MNEIAHHLAALASSSTQTPSTQRGPLLYVWWAVQALVVIAIVWGVTRLVRRRSNNRRSGRSS